MTKKEFLQLLTSEATAHFNDRDRDPEMWWLSMEELAGRLYYQATREVKPARV